MDEHEWLAERFEAHRTRMRAVAYRMLGSLSEADDAVQESWLRISRSDTRGVANLGGWLTTVVAPICLDMLRPLPTSISAASEQWSTPSSPPRAAVTSTRCSRCSTRTLCCAPTAGSYVRAPRWWFAVRRSWPSGHSPSRSPPRSYDRRS